MTSDMNNNSILSLSCRVDCRDYKASLLNDGSRNVTSKNTASSESPISKITTPAATTTTAISNNRNDRSINGSSAPSSSGTGSGVSANSGLQRGYNADCSSSLCSSRSGLSSLSSNSDRSCKKKQYSNNFSIITSCSNLSQTALGNHSNAPQVFPLPSDFITTNVTQPRKRHDKHNRWSNCKKTCNNDTTIDSFSDRIGQNIKISSASLFQNQAGGASMVKKSKESQSQAAVLSLKQPDLHSTASKHNAKCRSRNNTRETVVGRQNFFKATIATEDQKRYSHYQHHCTPHQIQNTTAITTRSNNGTESASAGLVIQNSLTSSTTTSCSNSTSNASNGNDNPLKVKHHKKQKSEMMFGDATAAAAIRRRKHHCHLQQQMQYLEEVSKSLKRSSMGVLSNRSQLKMKNFDETNENHNNLEIGNCRTSQRSSAVSIANPLHYGDSAKQQEQAKEHNQPQVQHQQTTARNNPYAEKLKRKRDNIEKLKTSFHGSSFDCKYDNTAENVHVDAPQYCTFGSRQEGPQDSTGKNKYSSVSNTSKNPSSSKEKNNNARTTSSTGESDNSGSGNRSGGSGNTSNGTSSSSIELYVDLLEACRPFFEQYGGDGGNTDINASDAGGAYNRRSEPHYSSTVSRQDPLLGEARYPWEQDHSTNTTDKNCTSDKNTGGRPSYLYKEALNRLSTNAMNQQGFDLLGNNNFPQNKGSKKDALLLFASSTVDKTADASGAKPVIPSFSSNQQRILTSSSLPLQFNQEKALASLSESYQNAYHKSNISSLPPVSAEHKPILQPEIGESKGTDTVLATQDDLRTASHTQTIFNNTQLSSRDIHEDQMDNDNKTFTQKDIHQLQQESSQNRQQQHIGARSNICKKNNGLPSPSPHLFRPTTEVLPLPLNVSDSEIINPLVILPPGKPVTLEEVISFTKTARLVIQATHPFLAVHANAAYCILSGIDSHSIIGQPIASLMCLAQLSNAIPFKEKKSNHSDKQGDKENNRNILTKLVLACGYGILHDIILPSSNSTNDNDQEEKSTAAEGIHKKPSLEINDKANMNSTADYGHADIDNEVQDKIVSMGQQQQCVTCQMGVSPIIAARLQQPSLHHTSVGPGSIVNTHENNSNDSSNNNNPSNENNDISLATTDTPNNRNGNVITHFLIQLIQQPNRTRSIKYNLNYMAGLTIPTCNNLKQQQGKIGSDTIPQPDLHQATKEDGDSHKSSGLHITALG